VLALIGAVYAFRNPTLLRLFLVWAFVCSMAVYSWAGEKFAWLAMHPLMPLLLLAGIGVQWIWSARSSLARYGGIAVVVAGLAYTVYSSYMVNAVHRADPKEFLVSTQSSEDVRRVAQRVYDIDARVFERTGKRLTVNIDSSEGATFPWAWYFRDLGVGYIDMKTAGYVPQSQVLIMTEASKNVLAPNLAAYSGQQFRFRVWWVRDWDKKFSPSAWWGWFTERKTWNDVGGMPEWVYVRRDAEAS
jgi:predicted membrane-bound mannosyltransferase